MSAGRSWPSCEHNVVVVWLDQRELDLLAALPRLLVRGEIGARLRLGVGRPIREALKERVAERVELRGHIRLAPRTQQDDVIRQRWDPKLRHSNYDRLVDVKRKLDPDNLFHHNQNIRP